MPTIDEWAKAEAERRWPEYHRDDYETERSGGYVEGVRDLAARLQDPDVIEAGGKALFIDHATDGIGETAPEIAETCERLVRIALSVMLAKIAEGE